MIFYIDSVNFSTATTIYLNELLTQVAPDGYYSNGTDYRRQVNGTLIEITPCPAAEVNSRTIFWYNSSNGTDANILYIRVNGIEKVQNSTITTTGDSGSVSFNPGDTIYIQGKGPNVNGTETLVTSWPGGGETVTVGVQPAPQAFLTFVGPDSNIDVTTSFEATAYCPVFTDFYPVLDSSIPMNYISGYGDNWVTSQILYNGPYPTTATLRWYASGQSSYPGVVDYNPPLYENSYVTTLNLVPGNSFTLTAGPITTETSLTVNAKGFTCSL